MSTYPVIVIGATGALGQRIARELAVDHTVGLVVRDPAKLPADLAALPHRQADLRDRTGLGRAFAELASEGRLHGIVNAAGVVAFGAFGELPSAVTEELVATNATGVLHVLDAAASLVEDGGYVANLTGAAADARILGMGAYCASKAAAAAALGVAGRELRRRNIRVVDVRLGHCETGLAARALHGVPPKMPTGIDPDMAARRIVDALRAGDTHLPGEAFT